MKCNLCTKKVCKNNRKTYLEKSIRYEEDLTQARNMLQKLLEENSKLKIKLAKYDRKKKREKLIKSNLKDLSERYNTNLSYAKSKNMLSHIYGINWRVGRGAKIYFNLDFNLMDYNDRLQEIFDVIRNHIDRLKKEFDDLQYDWNLKLHHDSNLDQFNIQI